MVNRFASPFEDDSFGQAGRSQPPEKSSLVALLGLVVALVSVVLAQFQQQRTRFWALIGVAALTIFVGLYQRLFSGIRKLLRHAHNARVVRKNSQELRRLSTEAGVFFDTSISRNDMLQGILAGLSQRQSNLGLTSRIPNAGIFHEHWHYLDSRIRGNSFSATGFHDAADELLSLLRSYTTFSVLPIFHLFAAEFREILMDNEKGRMNAFQQHYVGFLNSYTNFLLRLNDEFHGLPQFQPVMAKPTPL